MKVERQDKGAFNNTTVSLSLTSRESTLFKRFCSTSSGIITGNLHSWMSFKVYTVRNTGYEKGKFVQAEGKLVKRVEKGHYSPFGRN